SQSVGYFGAGGVLDERSAEVICPPLLVVAWWRLGGAAWWRMSSFWSQLRDLNPRPTVYESVPVFRRFRNRRVFCSVVRRRLRFARRIRGGLRVRHQEIWFRGARASCADRLARRAPIPYQRQAPDGIEKLRRNERRVVLRVHFSGPLAHETLARLAVNVCRREQSRERPPERAEVVRAPLRVRRWLPCELQILPEIFG